MKSAWWGIGLALAIGVVAYLAGRWSNGLLVALILLAVLGAVFPPLAILLGSVALVYLVLVHGAALAAWVTKAVNPPAKSASGSGGP